MHLSVGCVVFCLLLLTVKDTSGQVKPANAVAEVGGRAVLHCSDALIVPNWFMSKDGTSTNQLIIAKECIVSTNLQNHYAVVKEEGVTLPLSPFVCNLIVFNVTMDQAGVYWCTGSGDRSIALLTVLDSSPTITYNKKPDVMEGENVVITCSLNYSGSVETAPTLRPHFYWTDYTGDNVSNAYNPPPSNNSVVSQLTVTGGREDIMPYTCHVYLQLMPPVTSLYATNTPSVDKNASSPIITVLYAPSPPAITSRPEVTWINGVPCGISVLTCSNSTGNPDPNYRWFDAAENVILTTTNTLTLAEVNRNYKCEAYNTIRNVMHDASTTTAVSTDNCTSTAGQQCCDMNSPDESDLTRTIILACVLGGYGLLNLIATIAFIVYYNRKSRTSKQALTFRNKMTLNARFPWLQRMLPCMNESRGNAGCSFLWVLLFILMSVLAGIIVFPILVAMANCSRDNNDARDDSNNGMSNVYQEDTIDRNAASKSGTDAHGHVEAPYDEIGTMHPGRRVVLEETTSSNTKDAKKVFYTKVNPNFNAEEGVERYSVSLPS